MSTHSIACGSQPTTAFAPGAHTGPMPSAGKNLLQQSASMPGHLLRPGSAPSLSLGTRNQPRAWRRPQSPQLWANSPSAARAILSAAPQPQPAISSPQPRRPQTAQQRTPAPATWSDAARQTGEGVLLYQPAAHHTREAAIHKLRRERAQILEKPADKSALLAKTDERVPASCIPEEWHIKLALPQRPSHLDEYGSRFDWTPDVEAGGSGDPSGSGGTSASLSGSVGGASSSSSGDGSGSGHLTVFPMAEPYGALDIELLEHWLREVRAPSTAKAGSQTLTTQSTSHLDISLGTSLSRDLSRAVPHWALLQTARCHSATAKRASSLNVPPRLASPPTRLPTHPPTRLPTDRRCSSPKPTPAARSQEAAHRH